LFRTEGNRLTDAINHNEIVAEAMHFGKPHSHH
jgi:hypothetical protein